jgi:ribosomal protein S18 acetylase RimI-like enzyme
VDSCFYHPISGPPVPRLTHSGSVGVTIRNATSGDLSDLADVLARCFHSEQGLNRWLFPLLRLGIYEDLRYRLLLSPPVRYVCLVACGVLPDASPDREGVAGTVELTLRSFPPHPLFESHYLYISNLAVRNESRRQGVAQQLLQACERTAIEWGFSDIYLHVLEDNHQARQLYTKLGYQLKIAEETWSSWLFGKPRQLFLHKRLAKSVSI